MRTLLIFAAIITLAALSGCRGCERREDRRERRDERKQPGAESVLRLTRFSLN